jgi:hypothetical protein
MGLLDGGLLSALTQQEQLGGLLGSFKPGPDESLMTKIFGTSDVRDPRGAAMAGLASGLLRGSLAEGLDRYGRAWNDVEDRNTRRVGNNLQFAKATMELSEVQRRMQEEAESREVLRDFFARRARGQVPGTQKSMLPAIGLPTGGDGPVAQGGAAAPAAGGALLRPAGMSALYDQYQELASAYEAKGLMRQAQQARETALKFRPKFSTTPQVLKDPATGRLINVLIGEDGTAQVLPYGVKPDVHYLDSGGAIQALDNNEVAPGTNFPKSMTPGERSSNQVALGNLRVSQGNLQLSRDRFNAEQTAPQYMQLDGGLYALPTRQQPGAPLVGQPVMDQGGQPLGPPLKPIPSSANTAIMTNLQNLNRAQQALALVKGGQVGAAQGDTAATGVKGYLPNGLLNRMDPAGVDTRAAIADLGSLVIHDRSGAAVTAAESPRLMPFIPLATDDRATVEKKLKRFVEVYQQETDAYAQTYGRDQGYRENPALKRQAGNSNDVLPGALPLPKDLKATGLKRGQVYQLPNGQTARWDGFRFVGE